MPGDEKSFEWEHGSDEVVDARDLAAYERLLDFKAEDFRGKSILDLGAHRDETVVKGLRDRKIDCQAISFSPDFSLKKHTNTESDRKHQPAVAGVAQQLPFNNESFDYILDLGGPSVYVHSLPEQILFLQEAIRTLKKGGRYMGHLNFDDDLEEFTNLQAILETILKNITISHTRVKTRGGVPMGYSWVIEKQK